MSLITLSALAGSGTDLCKKDRSIAIAHGLEALCEAEPVKASRNAIQEEADNSEVTAS